MLAPKGEELVEVWEDSGKLLCHGTSLRLIAGATPLLNEDFETNPEIDWASSEECEIYYAIVEDPAEGAVCAALRAIVQKGDKYPVPRFVIEHVVTHENYRRQGIAGKMTGWAKRVAGECGMDAYVLAIMDTVTFWMAQEFVLEQDAALNEEYNEYSDTVLMRLPTNHTGSDSKDISPDYLATAIANAESDSEEEGEESDDSESEESDEEEEGGEEEGEDEDGDEEAELKAKLESAMEAAADARTAGGDPSEAEAEVAAVIAALSEVTLGG